MRFLRPLLAVVVAVFCLSGCGPEPRGSVPSDHPVRVEWTALVNDYRDLPEVTDRAYRSRTVQIYLPARSYNTAPGRIEAYCVIPGQPGALVFECAAVPGDNKTALLITGVCRGYVRDGIERASRIRFFVRITDCSVTVLQ